MLSRPPREVVEVGRCLVTEHVSVGTHRGQLACRLRPPNHRDPNVSHDRSQHPRVPERLGCRALEKMLSDQSDLLVTEARDGHEGTAAPIATDFEESLGRLAPAAH